MAKRMDKMESPDYGSERERSKSKSGAHRVGSKKTQKRSDGPRPSDLAGWDFNDPRFQESTKPGAYHPPAALKEVVTTGPSWASALKGEKPKVARRGNGRVEQETTREKLLMVRSKLGEGAHIAHDVFGNDVLPQTDSKTLKLETDLFNAYLSLPDDIDMGEARNYPGQIRKLVDKLVADLRKQGMTDQEMGQIKLLAEGVRSENKETGIRNLTNELRDTIRLGRPDLGTGVQYPAETVKQLSDQLLGLGVNQEMIKNIVDVSNMERDHLNGDEKSRLTQAEKFWYEHNLKGLEAAVGENLSNVNLLRKQNPNSKNIAANPEVIKRIEDFSQRVYGYHERTRDKEMTAQQATQEDLGEIKTRLFKENKRP